MIEREEQIFELWNKHPFAERALQTACGKQLRILSPGILNRDSGPDFFGAQIEVDGQVWSGNIEIHVRASDWLKHGHTTDKAFSNVILHVVYIHDCDIYDDHGNVIPVLVLSALDSGHSFLPDFDSAQSDKTHASRSLSPLDSAQSVLPDFDSAQFDKSDQTEHDSYRERSGRLHTAEFESLGVARLKRRCVDLETELVHLKGDMEALFQRHLFRRFGMRTNSEPFQQLAHRVHGSIIRRQRNNATDLEALLYGQSALLPQIPVDGYSADLLYRYVNFRYKYNLEPMYVQTWKFMRMRPSNFPTIRISQLAALLHQHDRISTLCLDHGVPLDELKQLFNVKASEYWDDHFRFGVFSGKHVKLLGDEALHSILINTVAQLRYFLGNMRGDETLIENALELLRMLPPEDTAGIRKAGMNPHNALESQGVLELLTQRGATNDRNNIVSENDFMYFSRINYERNQIHRSDCNVVREPRIRCLRLVG